jgi:uncharacterized NAD-dependent epimerase/dehydratase family protein
MIGKPLDGNAIVYCDGAFGTTNGKTAHGLVRFTRRYRVLSVVDSRHAGADAGELLDGKTLGIPVFASIDDAFMHVNNKDGSATHLVIGLAPDGGKLSDAARRDIKAAVKLGLSIDCGLHDYLSDDPEISKLAKAKGVTLRDIRKPPNIHKLHFFSGKIEEVTSLKVAVLGTDSAVGKRTTAWRLVFGFEEMGMTAELIGTGQTAWMQGAKYSIIMDSLVNDFVAGEIEHAVWSAWREMSPDAIVIEGQGSLMNPAYPGGCEILAAGRPDVVVLQHAPARKEYDGFPGYKLHNLLTQIQAIELLSGKPVVAITLNHENIPIDKIDEVCTEIEYITNLPVADVLVHGPGKIVNELVKISRRLSGRL